MAERWISAKNFSDPVQAELARERLEAAGIPTSMTGTEATNAFAGMGMDFATIKLEVREEDLQQAQQLLATPPPHTPADLEALSGTEDQTEDEEEPYDPDSSDAVADRAWKAAIFGMIVCPPLLHLYSLWLVLRLASRDEDLSETARWKMYGAVALDGVVLVGIALFLRSLADSFYL